MKYNSFETLNAQDSMILEVEQKLIGCMIRLGDLSVESAQRVFNLVKPSSMLSRSHKVIFESIKALELANQHIDLLLLADFLEKRNLLDGAGGFGYLAKCCEDAFSIAALIDYANIVREGAIKRAARTELLNAVALLDDKDGLTIYQKLGAVESKLGAILSRSMNGQEKAGLQHCGVAIENWLNEVNEMIANPEKHTGYTLGIDSMDQVIGVKGIRRQSLVVVGGRPKMGKTFLKAAFIERFALHYGAGVAAFTLEMSAIEMAERALLGRAGVHYEDIYDQQRGGFEQAITRASAAAGEYLNSDYYIDETPAVSLEHVKREARKLNRDLAIKGKRLELITIDYLTLMDSEKAERNDLAYGKITKGLKALAKELDCVVVLLTQLNRNLESRHDKRPFPSDSRDTGQIEQDCDLWIGLYREAVYNDSLSQDQQWLTEALIRLNRHGGTGTGYLRLKNSKFINTDKFEFSSNSGYSDDY